MSEHQIAKNPISTSDVEKFLHEHPEFFMQRPELLAELKLPHDSGNAVSLVERQVSVLRDRNADIRRRLSHLLEAARTNDTLFNRVQTLTLALLDARSTDEIITELLCQLRDDFSVDVCNVLVISPNKLPTRLNVHQVTTEEAQREIPAIISSPKALCGNFRKSEMQFLFPEARQQPVKSAAVAPFTCLGLPAFLALGSFDADHYQASNGTLFLNYVAEILNRLIAREKQ
ncbi:MAG: DUF484 family protein [Pseudomonadales bacterium]|nr:DUF484 family protein [Pseudomonadales bacterium]